MFQAQTRFFLSFFLFFLLGRSGIDFSVEFLTPQMCKIPFPRFGWSPDGVGLRSGDVFPILGWIPPYRGVAVPISPCSGAGEGRKALLMPEGTPHPQG